MRFTLGYDVRVRRFFSASVALGSLLALTSLFSVAAHAQKTSSSASSSSGHTAHASSSAVRFSSSGPHGSPSHGGNPPKHAPSGTSVQSQHTNVQFVTPMLYAVPFPYAVDLGSPDAYDDPDDEADYQGGPTVFDRRGYGADSYVPPVEDTADDPPSQVADADPPAPEEPTLLVFKDGHTLELGNYAIVGSTLFDLTPGRRRKIALADLDLEATQRENDDHGVAFQIPPISQAD